MTSPVLTIRNGPLSLQIVPAVGGAISRFWTNDGARSVELFHPMPQSAIAESNPLLASCFPLVPLSNRIENGRYVFRGRSFRMPPNLPPHPHPLHGHGWLSSWSVVDQSEATATVRFDYRGEDWPSSYTATQHFELSTEKLAVELTLQNSGTLPMPAGIGLHPFFPRNDATVLTAELGRVWLVREDLIPEQRAPLPAHWDFGHGLCLGELDLDHCFDGWNGRATVHFPEPRLDLVIEADPVFSHVVIYAPPGKPFFCFEPVSHANFLLNLAEQGVTDIGLRILEPGESLRGCVRFGVQRRED